MIDKLCFLTSWPANASLTHNVSKTRVKRLIKAVLQFPAQVHFSSAAVDTHRERNLV